MNHPGESTPARADERLAARIIGSLIGPWRSLPGLCAVVLIGLQTLWRGAIIGRGYFTQDDFLMIKLGAGRLSDLWLYNYAGHWFPGGFVFAWLQAQAGPLDWRWAAGMIIGLQVIAAVLMWLVLTRLAPHSWGRVPAFAVMLTTPMSLWSTQWWAVAIQFLPVTIFLLVAVWGLLVSLDRDPRWAQPLVVAAVVGGLAFQERGLLIPVVLVFVAVALLEPKEGESSSLLSGVWGAVLAYRWLWATLAATCFAYLVVHRQVAPVAVGTERGAEPGLLVINYLFRLFPTMAWGGPWRARVLGESSLQPSAGVVVLTLAATVALVIWTLRRGRWATRWAWLLLAAYLVLDVALLFAGRTSLGEVAGLVPRYVADVAPVLAITLGLIAGDRASTPSLRAASKALGATGAYVAAAAITTTWMVPYFLNAPERAYVETLRAQLRGNPQVVLFDGAVPDTIMISWFGPDAKVSTVAGLAPENPLFNVPSYEMRMVDPAGFLREIDLLGATQMVPNSS
ncbi:MAG: hypothetical protein WAW88_12950, partial [Nocardioides sp.]